MTAAKFTVQALLTNAKTDVVMVSTRKGDQLAFRLCLTEQDGQGIETTKAYIIPPDELQGLCSLIHQTLQAQGYAIPNPPQGDETPQH